MTRGSLGDDRRAWMRWTAAQCPWLRSIRLFPGTDLRLVNLSRGGALVELSARLLPGAWVRIRIVTAHELHVGRAQVVRCAVAMLGGGGGLVYRAAIRFERGLQLQPLLESSSGCLSAGYAVPGMGG